MTVCQSDDLLALAIGLDGVLIGDASLQLRSVTAEARTVELGWIIDPEYGGHGYATEAAAQLASLAFDALGAKLITAVIRPANTRSIALVRRLGFSEMHRDDDSVLFTLTSHDFAAVRRGSLALTL